MNMCRISVRLPRESCLKSFNFCLWGWTKSEVYKRKVDRGEEMIAGILDAAARVNKREEQL